ncbi:MAG TPA: TPM domain-containing protein, partial [Sphingobium sp.]|nr:TPM domain-containing protein [Sphingobium sp.]
MLRRILIALFALVLLLPVAASQAQAQSQPAFPKLTGRVVDDAGLLTPPQRQALEARLAAFEASTRQQLVVATVRDLGGNDIADYGYRLGRAWGIGQAGVNNGVILLVAPNERRVRIEVGYGLEPVLTDALSGRIIRQIITPRFKNGDFAGGIEAGANEI